MSNMLGPRARLIPINELTRVYWLRVDGRLSTCFTVVRNGRQYVVTAEHCVRALNGMGGRIEVHETGGWQEMDARVLGLGTGGIDIAVLAIERPLPHPAMPVEETMGGLIYGQEALFVGYPRGLAGDIGAMYNHRPLPLMKRTLIGGVRNGVENPTYLDAYNVEGFSGGPVYFPSETAPHLRLGLVISGYPHASTRVIDKSTDAETGYVVKVNIGITVAYNIQTALDIILREPHGCPMQ